MSVSNNSVSNNNKSIHILRGDQNYDPSSINTLLDDGQPFYSKKNQQLYIGDDTKKDPTNPEAALTSPVGAANLIPGSKGACNVIQLNKDDENAAATANRCTHNGAAVFGFNTQSTNANQFIAGRYNKTETSGNEIFVVGDGTSDADNDRHNAIEVKDNQSTYINSNIQFGDQSLINIDDEKLHIALNISPDTNDYYLLDGLDEGKKSSTFFN